MTIDDYKELKDKLIEIGVEIRITQIGISGIQCQIRNAYRDNCILHPRKTGISIHNMSKAEVDKGKWAEN